MKNSELRVGMRVRVVGVQDGGKGLVGKVGTVKRRCYGIKNTDTDAYAGAIEFRKADHSDYFRTRVLHNCSGACRDDLGYWFEARNIQPARSRSKKAS